MINKGPQPLAPSIPVKGGGVNPVGTPTLPPLPLIKGQVIEGEVIQTKPNLLVETHASIFSAVLGKRQFAIGERLLFRVINPDTVPPKLQLINEPHLTSSTLAQQSPLLRSLLFRHDSLQPLSQWLGQLLAQPQDHEETPLMALLRQFWQLPKLPKGDDIQRLLLTSGLFREARGKAGLAQQMIGPATSATDLKALLQLLIADEQQVHLKPLLDAIASTQVKALDALLNNQLYYQWLIPWSEQGFIWAQLRQSTNQKQRRQWSLQLSHEGPELGSLNINMLLTEGVTPTGNSLATLHFASSTLWLGELVQASRNRLQDALTPHNIVLQQVSVGPIVTNSNADPIEDTLEQTSILDIKV